MAISTSLRNRIVGFTIVASSILIFLPVLLSKDMIKGQNSNTQAIAIDNEGVVLDANGDLVLQAEPDSKKALNINQQHPELAISTNPTPAVTNEHLNAEVNNDLMASALLGDKQETKQPPVQTQAPSATKPAESAKNEEEILTVKKKPAAQESAKQTAAPKPAPKKEETEILTVKKKEPAKQTATTVAPSKPAQATSSTTKVVAGSRPNANYVIQVGVFSMRANAENVVKKIKSAGINVYAIEVPSGERRLTRIYAASGASRDSLKAILTQIDKLCGTKGRIIPASEIDD